MLNITSLQLETFSKKKKKNGLQLERKIDLIEYQKVYILSSHTPNSKFTNNMYF